jgi:hypothetical protein
MSNSNKWFTEVLKSEALEECAAGGGQSANLLEADNLGFDRLAIGYYTA